MEGNNAATVKTRHKNRSSFLWSWATLNIRHCPVLNLYEILERKLVETFGSMTHLTVNILWTMLRMWVRWEGRRTNLDCWQSSALGEPSVCALTEDTQTKGWEPGTSCPQPPFSPSSCLVHLYLQQKPGKIFFFFREMSKAERFFLTAVCSARRHFFLLPLYLLSSWRNRWQAWGLTKGQKKKKRRQHSLKPAKCRRHSSLGPTSPPHLTIQSPSVSCY